ncbi:DEKNAAC104169 [Brettanomyces naardenensis]|uniref:DEKNAAC104170 n=1 Tax=Brettanomyces naardenensis TaxID=13370 RepID=A0A448YPS3_BRENA|nr:DEKNAAC104169 [Brettanomyces naardenensis]
MGTRRHKKRTHVVQTEEEFNKVPRSMVIHLGTALHNHTITQLVRDVRNMMQPHTTINLRERKANKVKDFVSVAGSLGVSMLMIFSQNDKTGGIHLRFAKMGHGPTISFKVLEYSLCKDVTKTLHNPKSLSKGSVEFQSPPLLVLNGFTNPKEAESYEKLVITMFQNLFPPISPQNTKVGTIKRVLLINKDKQSGRIDVRHYMIDTKLIDVSKNVRKLVGMKKRRNGRIPNLSRVEDVSEIILDPLAAAGGFTSDSEVETDAVVEVREEMEENATKQKKIGVKKVEIDTEKDENEGEGEVRRKRAVKLTEIGPRLKLELVKIEEGVCDGKVMYHSYIKKSEEEEERMEEEHVAKRRKREQRKKEQRENIQKKRKVKIKDDVDEEGQDEKEIEKEHDQIDIESQEDIEDIENGSNDDKLFDE